jgi:hypothetical protein
LSEWWYVTSVDPQKGQISFYDGASSSVSYEDIAEPKDAGGALIPATDTKKFEAGAKEAFKRGINSTGAPETKTFDEFRVLIGDTRTNLSAPIPTVTERTVFSRVIKT